MNFFQRFFGHLKTVTKHRWWVCYYCFKAGIPWQGLVHDLSKFSPTEFWESVKYYQGFRSPIDYCKEVNGWSKAWMHHKGRNRHHYEYWNDYNPKTKQIENVEMPLNYVIEMFCDRVAASKIYNGSNYKDRDSLDYFGRVKGKHRMHENTEKLLEELLTMLSEKGEEETFAYIRKLRKIKK